MSEPTNHFPSPRRIRDENGHVPPLTEAQRAKIITIDLDNPPPFVGVIQDPAEIAPIIRGAEMPHSVWIYRPQWRSLAEIIDRQTVRADHTERFIFYKTTPSPKIARRFDEAVIALQSKYANRFLKNVSALTQAIGQQADCRETSASLDVEWRSQQGDVHIDPCFRMLAALEHGGVLLPDQEIAAAKGFKFSNDPHGMRQAVEIFDLIEADVPVYSPALGDFALLQGYADSRRPTWHAAYQMSSKKERARFTVRADFRL